MKKIVFSNISSSLYVIGSCIQLISNFRHLDVLYIQSCIGFLVASIGCSIWIISFALLEEHWEMSTFIVYAVLLMVLALQVFILRIRTTMRNWFFQRKLVKTNGGDYGAMNQRDDIDGYSTNPLLIRREETKAVDVLYHGNGSFQEDSVFGSVKSCNTDNLTNDSLDRYDTQTDEEDMYNVTVSGQEGSDLLKRRNSFQSLTVATGSSYISEEALSNTPTPNQNGPQNLFVYIPIGMILVFFLNFVDIPFGQPVDGQVKIRENSSSLQLGPYILGCIGAIIFIASRLPQIVNILYWQRSSGINSFGYAFIVLGGVFVILSLFNGDFTDLDGWISVLPWMFGCVGMIFFDLVILALILVTRKTKQETKI